MATKSERELSAKLDNYLQRTLKVGAAPQVIDPIDWAEVAPILDDLNARLPGLRA